MDYLSDYARFFLIHQKESVIRIRYLDSLRGIAAFCVLIHHFIGGFGLPGLPLWLLHSPLGFIVDGVAAVVLFFVISGFVLSYKAFSDIKNYSFKDSFDTFLIHRIMRIMPPFIAWVFISAFFQRYLFPFAQGLPGPTPWLQATWPEIASFTRVLREIFIISPASGGHLVPQDWTLTYELNISLFMPLYTLLAIAGNIPFYFYLLLRSAKNIFLFHFFLGMVVSKNFEKIKKTTNKTNPLACFGLLFLGLSLYSFRYIAGSYVESFLPTQAENISWIMNGLGAALIIIVAIGSETFQKVLLNKPLIWLGKISYSLYLLHIAVLKCLTPIILSEITKRGINNTLAIWLSLVVTSIICLIFADVSYRLFEAPSITLGKIITQKWKKLIA